MEFTCLYHTFFASDIRSFCVCLRNVALRSQMAVVKTSTTMKLLPIQTTKRYVLADLSAEHHG